MRPAFLAFGWMLVVLALLSIPGQELPQVDFHLADKVAHAACFFVLGLLWMRTLHGSWLRRATLTFIIGAFFGVGTEIYQALMPIGRMFDPLDALADGIGTLVAILTWRVGARKKAERQSNREPSTVS